MTRNLPSSGEAAIALPAAATPWCLSQIRALLGAEVCALGSGFRVPNTRMAVLFAG